MLRRRYRAGSLPVRALDGRPGIAQRHHERPPAAALVFEPGGEIWPPRVAIGGGLTASNRRATARQSVKTPSPESLAKGRVTRVPGCSRRALYIRFLTGWARCARLSARWPALIKIATRAARGPGPGTELVPSAVAHVEHADCSARAAPTHAR